MRRIDPHRGQGLYDLHGFEADVDDLTDEAEDVFGIAGAVGIVGDAAALVGGDRTLVDDPLQGRAVAQAIFVGLPGKGQFTTTTSHLFDKPRADSIAKGGRQDGALIFSWSRRTAAESQVLLVQVWTLEGPVRD